MTLKAKFETYRETLRSSINKTKKMYYQKLFDLYRNDMKKTWLTIKETLHSIPPLHLYLYYLCFVVTVYRCYNPVIVQHTIALCPLSTPKQWCSGAGTHGNGVLTRKILRYIFLLAIFH